MSYILEKLIYHIDEISNKKWKRAAKKVLPARSKVMFDGSVKDWERNISRANHAQAIADEYPFDIETMRKNKKFLNKQN